MHDFINGLWGKVVELGMLNSRCRPGSVEQLAVELGLPSSHYRLALSNRCRVGSTKLLPI
ncbi:hypothetical protein U1Q18_030051 [Sarracenia purpurea var. burkii]